ncbi:MAG: hypothetical protein MZV70_59705 [Desulfobacterales bacterium]|nr:hypothetical protein [Desulfobacterales bacterium]
MVDSKAPSSAHKWNFAPRFRRNAFGWRSQPALTRVKEAVAEIKKTARADPVLAAEGAVLFLEKVSPALSHVDSSSGAIGSAVNNAIDILVPIIAGAPADGSVRDRWMERLWQAVEADDIPYIELLPDYWGELCATPERASRWADSFIEKVRTARNRSSVHYGYFKGTSACLSALFRAGRHEEILSLLEQAPHKFWYERKWGVKALSALGRKAEAIRYAEDSRGINEPEAEIAQACEEILLAGGMTDEAYARYAIAANRGTTHLATFRAIVRKYPQKTAGDILHDLVESTPGEEGKWFTSAKSAGLHDEAVVLANMTPCDPRTLTRAARDEAEEHPDFAVEAAVAALRWICEGYGYEITYADVGNAYRYAMEAAENAGSKHETLGAHSQTGGITDPGRRVHCKSAHERVEAGSLITGCEPERVLTRHLIGWTIHDARQSPGSRKRTVRNHAFLGFFLPIE